MFSVVDDLMQSMFLCSRCFCVVDVLVWSIFEDPWGISLAGTVDVSTLNVLTLSNFEVPQGMIYLHRPL